MKSVYSHAETRQQKQRELKELQKPGGLKTNEKRSIERKKMLPQANASGHVRVHVQYRFHHLRKLPAIQKNLVRIKLPLALSNWKNTTQVKDIRGSLQI